MRFSIITATKNNKEGLLRAIECLRNQTYNNVEHIIVDGGSTDGSVEAIKNLQLTMHNSGNSGVILKRMKDLHSGIDSSPAAQNDSEPTSHYQLLSISEPDEGIYDAINKGIKLATGDVIGLLHSDDLYADENLIEKYAEVFKRSFDSAQCDRVDAVYSDLVYVRQKREVRSEPPKASLAKGGKLESDSRQAGMTDRSTTNYSLPTDYSIVRYWKTHKAVNSNQSSVKSKDTDHYSLVTDHLLRNGWMPPHPTLFIRKEVFERYGLYNTELKIASDYEMILKLFYKHKITAYYLPVTTYLMSIGGASNKSIGNIITKSREDYTAMKRNGIPFPLYTLLCKNFRKFPQFLARDNFF